jgi:hypothetical protein
MAKKKESAQLSITRSCFAQDNVTEVRHTLYVQKVCSSKVMKHRGTNHQIKVLIREEKVQGVLHGKLDAVVAAASNITCEP